MVFVLLKLTFTFTLPKYRVKLALIRKEHILRGLLKTPLLTFL